jgi:hypothetical protein
VNGRHPVSVLPADLRALVQCFRSRARLWPLEGLRAPLMRWVAQHRAHHQHSDSPEDPHSPHHRGGGVLGRLRGFWHAHVGWTFGPDAASSPPTKTSRGTGKVRGPGATRENIQSGPIMCFTFPSRRVQ